MLYRIIVSGRVGSRIAPIFPELVVEDDGELSIIIGPIKDQAHLHGILAVIRDLNVALLTVEKL